MNNKQFIRIGYTFIRLNNLEFVEFFERDVLVRFTGREHKEVIQIRPDENVKTEHARIVAEIERPV